MTFSTADVVGVLRSWRYKIHREEQLRDGIAAALDGAKIPFLREHWLSDDDRIDFLVDGHLGLEAKLSTSTTEMTRQLHRYAQHEVVHELLLVTTSLRLSMTIPAVMNGKPITFLPLLDSVFGI